MTDDGPKVAGLTIAAIRDEAPVAIDVIGVGASPYYFLLSHNQQVIGVNVSERSFATDKSGRLAFANLRSELWWKAREMLDPANNTGIQIPPDDRLKIDLCAPKWKMQGAMIRVESREEYCRADRSIAGLRLGIPPGHDGHPQGEHATILSWQWRAD